MQLIQYYYYQCIYCFVVIVITEEIWIATVTMVAGLAIDITFAIAYPTHPSTIAAKLQAATEVTVVLGKKLDQKLVVNLVDKKK